jgi:hypothetical protein
MVLLRPAGLRREPYIPEKAANPLRGPGLQRRALRRRGLRASRFSVSLRGTAPRVVLLIALTGTVARGFFLALYPTTAQQRLVYTECRFFSQSACIFSRQAASVPAVYDFLIFMYLLLNIAGMTVLRVFGREGCGAELRPEHGGFWVRRGLLAVTC